MRTSNVEKRPPPKRALQILRLVQGQQTALATDFNDLLGDGGPADETADEMILAIREWRDRRETPKY